MFGPAQYAVAKAVADCVADGTIPASAGRRPGHRLRRLHPPRRRGQRQDPQVQLRGDQALDRARHEEPADRRARSPRRKTRSSTRSPVERRSRIGDRLDSDWAINLQRSRPWQHETEDPDPARHRPAAQRLRRRGGGRCGRRPPVPPRRSDAGHVRDLVYGALFTRGPPTCTPPPSSSAARTWRPARRCSKPSRRRSSARSGSRSCSTPTAPTRRPRPPSWRPCESMGGSLEGVPPAVLAATGPVGQRVARLLCRLGAKVAVGSRSLDRAGRAGGVSLRDRPAAPP